MISAADQLNSACLRRAMLLSELGRLSMSLGHDLVERVEVTGNVDPGYFDQFQSAVRTEASAMAKHYEVFYCLEKSIRSIVVGKLLAEVGTDWWNTAVPDSVRTNSEKNRQRELESAMTRRSDSMIDYTTFGELGEIVRQNWQVFSDLFSSQKGFDRVMTSLNLLRAPIAHCCPLAQDEIDRLHLTVKDWFRLME